MPKSSFPWAPTWAKLALEPNSEQWLLKSMNCMRILYKTVDKRLAWIAWKEGKIGLYTLNARPNLQGTDIVQWISRYCSINYNIIGIVQTYRYSLLIYLSIFKLLNYNDHLFSPCIWKQLICFRYKWQVYNRSLRSHLFPRYKICSWIHVSGFELA